MTGLLVSVRSAAEARAALDGGADLIDVKEPLRGALGAADPSIWREVAKEVAGVVPLSAALGELLSGDLAKPSTLALLAPAYRYAKVGLAGCAESSDWPLRWEAILRSIPESVSPVAVVYADWHLARSPKPIEVLQAGIKLGCEALLVDTLDKSTGDLFCHLPLSELNWISNQATEAGMTVVLGGSLTPQSFPLALGLYPDYVAVRGAACRNSRAGQVAAELVRNLAEIARRGDPVPS